MNSSGIRNIYSSIEKDVLLHQYYKPCTQNSRINISPAHEFLQLAHLNLKENQIFKSHKHLEIHRKTNITQETWIVIKGLVKVSYYDLDNSFIESINLSSGECTITYRGGHNYQSLDEATTVYEIKSGPYLGPISDKINF